MSRKIYLIGDIDESAFQSFSEQLAVFEKNKSNRDPIEIDLNSGGGSAMDALAFCSRIRNSKLQINVTVYGLVGSAAVLVFAACNNRRMTKESWMMVHEDSVNLKTINTTQYEKQAKHMRRLESQWCRLLFDFTGTEIKVWERLHKEETYLNPNECVNLGIATEIV